MALIVNQNLYSLSSQHHLGISQGALGRSIERLSSGLRINRAADDASGMAISEKMRGQISGLKRASMNAQDGISYLQTAEGAMEQTSSILQRMRELAVQASNGIYTTSDRQEIQKEVDQLKDEIDRISTSVEFNTRKLINGDATAIWAASSDMIGAIISAPVDEGNYEIQMAVRPGENQVWKSNIFALNKDAQGVELIGAGTTNVESIINPSSMPPSDGDDYSLNVSAGIEHAVASASGQEVSIQSSYNGNLNLTLAAGSNQTAAPVGSVQIYGTTTATFTLGTANTSGYIKMDVLKNAADASDPAVDASYFKITMFDAKTGASKELVAGTDFTYDPATGEIDMGTLGSFTLGDPTAAIASGDSVFTAVQGAETAPTGSLNLNAGTDYPVVHIDSTDGGSTWLMDFDPATGLVNKHEVKVVNESTTDPVTALVADTITTVAAGTPVNQSAEVVGRYNLPDSSWTTSDIVTNDVSHSGYLEVEMLKTTDSVGTAEFRVRFIDAKTGKMGAWQEIKNGADDSLNINYEQDGVTVNLSVDTLIGAGSTIQKGDKMLIGVSQAAGPIEAGGGVISITDGPDGVTSGVNIVFNEAESITPTDNGDGILDTNAVDVYYASLDSTTGNLNLGNMTVNFKEVLPPDPADPDSKAVTPTGTATFEVIGGGDVATSNTKLRDIKSFTNADGVNIFDYKQELTIYGNGTSTVVNLEGNDTIATLVEKLNKAIVEDLGMGSDDPLVNANLVRYVTLPTDGGIEAVKGTLIIQTAMAGTQGELSFIGQDALITGLGLNEIRESTNNESTVTIRDAHTGDLIGTEVTGNDRVSSLLKGVEVTIDSRAGVETRWDAANNKIVFESNDDLAKEKYYLHLVDNRTSLQIGANKGQHIDVSIPQLDLKGLGLENMTMVSQKLAQEAIGMLDNALTKVVSARATVGAQVSRLEYTIENLSTAARYLTESESRIRDLDVAEESTAFAKNQVLVQSGISMLAQANQLPQMALELIRG